YARTLQQFDVTFYQREPILDVRLDRDFAREFMTALGCWKRHEFVRRLQPLIQCIVFSDGTKTHVDDIWTITYMPDGITIARLDGAGLVMAETKAGYGGETIRQMICATYRCGSAAEEDWFVRRWIAS